MVNMARRSYPPPEGDYITAERFDEIVKDETDPMYRLLFKTVWRLGLRISEAVGQTEYDRTQLQNYREARIKEVEQYNKKHAKFIKQGVMKAKNPPPDNDIELIPGIRPMDIDAVKGKDVGLKCKHTIRLWRKGGKYNILPLSDDLHAELVTYARKKKITSENKIFAVSRHDAYGRLSKYGYTVGGRKKVHPHALRRGFGVSARANGTPMEVLQHVYNHSQLYMTQRYIGLDKTEALNKWAEMQNK
jgi:integrase